jgi:hypothetical protein
MKTKWGSCNREKRNVWFNVELAKKDPMCLEYIVVHELMHYFERGHHARFAALMDQHLPDWRTRRDELNGSPLAEEVWQWSGGQLVKVHNEGQALLGSIAKEAPAGFPWVNWLSFAEGPSYS